ncbi:MAG TPA: hypothetical protein VIC85_05615 [Ktedonobacterales bacterium]|jgi:hypothetical protein
MKTQPRTPATLETLAARLADMEAAHAREVAALRAELAAVGSAPTRLASIDIQPPAPPAGPPRALPG